MITMKAPKETALTTFIENGPSSGPSSLHRPWEKEEARSSAFPFSSPSLPSPFLSPASLPLQLSHLYSPVGLVRTPFQLSPSPLSAGMMSSGIHMPVPRNSSVGNYAVDMNGFASPHHFSPMSFVGNPTTFVHAPSTTASGYPYFDAPVSASSGYSSPRSTFNRSPEAERNASRASPMPSTSMGTGSSMQVNIKEEEASDSYGSSENTEESVKKRRKPPPIQIDSSISNFAPRVPAPVHASLPNGLNSPLFFHGAYGPMMSPGPYTHGGRLSSLMGAPLPSPLYSAPPYLNYQHPADQFPGRHLYDSPLTPLASSGYGSVDNPMQLLSGSAMWPMTSFAFLCFLPGTKLKLLMGDESPSRFEWQPAEVFRADNLQVDFKGGLRLMSYVKTEATNGVELDFRLADSAPDRPAPSIRALCTLYHPFFSFQRGAWLSLDPSSTRKVYGLPCLPLEPGDVLAVYPPEQVNSLMLGAPVHGFGHGGPLSENFLASWDAGKNRRAMSLESVSHGEWAQTAANMNMGLMPLPLNGHGRDVKIRAKKEKREKKPGDPDKEKAKRPMNAFMLFAQQYRVMYTQRFPGRDNRAISCLLGEHWKSLDVMERQKYTDEAKSLAETYKEKNPNCWKRRSRSRSDAEDVPSSADRVQEVPSDASPRSSEQEGGRGSVTAAKSAVRKVEESGSHSATPVELQNHPRHRHRHSFAFDNSFSVKEEHAGSRHL